MNATVIAGRIHANLTWASVFGPDNPWAPPTHPADLLRRVTSAWNEPDETFAALLFLWLLKRPAAPPEIAAYRAVLAAGSPRAALVRRMALSGEARAHGLDVSWLPWLEALEPDAVWRRVAALWQAPDRAFVEGLFPVLLVRPADEATATALRDQLAAGAPRAAVVRELALSGEARACDLDSSWLPRLGGLAVDALWRRVEALWQASDRDFVEGLYRVLLARSPEESSLKAYCAALAAGTRRTDVVRSVALSAEAQAWNPDVSWLARLDALEPTVPAPRSRILSFRSLKSACRRFLAVWKPSGPRRPRPISAATKQAA